MCSLTVVPNHVIFWVFITGITIPQICLMHNNWLISFCFNNIILNCCRNSHYIEVFLISGKLWMTLRINFDLFTINQSQYSEVGCYQWRWNEVIILFHNYFK